jgi:hypothetical protein
MAGYFCEDRGKLEDILASREIYQRTRTLCNKQPNHLANVLNREYNRKVWGIVTALDNMTK